MRLLGKKVSLIKAEASGFIYDNDSSDSPFLKMHYDAFERNSQGYDSYHFVLWLNDSNKITEITRCGGLHMCSGNSSHKIKRFPQDVYERYCYSVEEIIGSDYDIVYIKKAVKSKNKKNIRHAIRCGVMVADLCDESPTLKKKLGEILASIDSEKNYESSIVIELKGSFSDNTQKATCKEIKELYSDYFSNDSSKTLQDIYDAVKYGDEYTTLSLIDKASDEGVPVNEILEKGIRSGFMGALYQDSAMNFSPPELLIARRAANEGIEKLKTIGLSVINNDMVVISVKMGSLLGLQGDGGGEFLIYNTIFELFRFHLVNLGDYESIDQIATAVEEYPKAVIFLSTHEQNKCDIFSCIAKIRRSGTMNPIFVGGEKFCPNDSFNEKYNVVFSPNKIWLLHRMEFHGT